MTLFALILLILALITWPALYFAEKYLDWPLFSQRLKWFPLALVLPLGGGLLLHEYGGMEKLSAFMVVLFVIWGFVVAKSWVKVNQSGIMVRLGRSRFQRLYLGLAALMLVTQIPNWMLNAPTQRLASFIVFPVMLGVMALLPNYLSGAGVWLNGSLIGWGHVTGATWREASEPLLIHTKGFLGTGQLAVPVSDAQREEVESILRAVAVGA